MIPVDEAQKIILDEISLCNVKRTKITQAQGKVLAEDIYSHCFLPEYDLSAMDGYALRSEDTKNPPTLLRLVEDIPAGHIPTKKIKEKETSRIMTGALIPDGADAVIMVEYTEKDGSMIKIKKSVEPYENIIKKGEDIKKGELLIKKGTTIGPAEIGILASLGISQIKTIKTPKIAILSTGDEIIDISEKPSFGKIRNVNTYILSAQIKEIGAIPINLGIAKDEEEEIREKITLGLEKADIIITSGGVSVGSYDIVEKVLKKMGLIVKFHNVAMRPGKPNLFGIIQGKPFFGLPGYPVSSMVSFEILVRPAILKMMGKKDLFRPTINAILKEDIKKKPNRRYYLRVKLEKTEKGITAKLTGPQGSGILSSMLYADGLLILNKETTFVEKGSNVSVYLLKNIIDK